MNQMVAFEGNSLENAIYHNNTTRAASLGGAYTGVGLGAEAIYYNPGSFSGKSSSFYYNESDRNTAFYRKSLQKVVKLGYLAFGSSQTIIDNDFSDISTFSLKLFDQKGIGLGLSYHKIVFSIDDLSYRNQGTGTSFDVGLELRLTRTLKLGILAKNFSVYHLPLAPGYRIGVGQEWGPFLFAYDKELINYYNSDNQDSHDHFGVEFRFVEELSILAGTSSLGNSIGFNLNLGNIDYYVGYEKRETEYVHYFSLALGKKENNFTRRRQTVAISHKDFLVLNIDRIKAGSNIYSILGGKVTGTDYLVDIIRTAAEDDLIGGIIIKIGGISNSLSSAALMEELRSELEKFKSNGKKVIAYIEGEATGNGYYLASVADKIYMPRGGAVLMLGKNLTITRYKGLLEKIGISAEIYKIGRYKDSLNSMNDGFDDKQKERIVALVKSINDEITAPVKLRVPISKNQAPLLEGNFIPAKKAMELGLIDQIGFYQDLTDAIKEISELSYKPRLINVRQFMRTESNYSILPVVNNVAIINIEGEISSGENSSDILFGNKSVGAKSIVKLVSQIEKNPTIKAVILRINSPGGSALASDRIYAALNKLKDKNKFIVASMGNVAASGGYFIACAADKIIANKTTLTGSIGVIGVGMKAKKLYEKLGIKEDVIKTGKYMDIFNTGVENDEYVVKMINEYQYEIYEQFKKAVAQSRGIAYKDVEKVAQGQIFSGAEALKNGLVDENGNFTRAIELVKEELNDNNINLVNYVSYKGNWYSLPSRIAISLGLENGLMNKMLLKNRSEISQYMLFDYSTWN